MTDTQAKHTLEPWEFGKVSEKCEWTQVTGPLGQVVANINAESGPDASSAPCLRVMPQHANAQRIVACVNACKGINPDAVPDMLEALEIIAQAEEHACDRCEGNGRLYADGKAHYFTEGAPTVACGVCGGTGRVPVDFTALQDYASAALAKAKGEKE